LQPPYYSPPPQEPGVFEWIFLNRRGLRAGWRLAIYLGLCLVGLFVVGVGIFVLWF